MASPSLAKSDTIWTGLDGDGRGFREDGDVAQARHFAAHPEDQDADIVLFKFCYDEELADHCEDYVPAVGPARKEP